METNSDSDSKEDSVIEAKPSVRFQTDLKKEKFKGFYSNTQKTILYESSVDDHEEKQKLHEENKEDEDDPQFLFEEVLDELTNIPIPVLKDVAVTKKIFKSYEDNSAGDETEDSECSGQEHLDDHVENETLQHHPEFNIDQKDTNVSHVIQRSGTLEDKEETEDNNTSSEEDEDDEEQGSKGLSKVEEEEKSGSSEESDVEVSDLDYYKIRHETEFVEENQFRLKPSTITLTQSMDGRKTGQRRCSIPYIKVIKPRNAEDDNDTDDEDISCSEDDFMTKEEFFEAHKTDYDLTKKQVRLVVSHSFCEKSGEETNDEDTESIRESLESDSEITDEDDLVNNIPEGIVHSPGCRFAVTPTSVGEILIETSGDENDDYDKIDHSDFDKSAITEMDDTDHTEEDLITDMEEDTSKGEKLTVTKTTEGKDNNKLYVVNKTLSPRLKKNMKKRNRRQ